MPKKINYADLFTLRSDGRYMGYWHEPDGRRHAIYDRDPEKLYQKIQEKESPTARTFEAVADEWRVDHVEKLSAHTQHYYNHILDELISIHGKTPLEEVDAPEINRTIMSLAAKGFAAKTVRMYRSVYKMIFDYAIVQGDIRYNPTSGITTPRNLPHKTREAPDDKVIALIKENAETAHFGLFPLFLIYTGFRRCEALAVQWQDIDFEKKTIRCTKTVEQINNKAYIKEPKTKAGIRTVPLLDGLSKAIKKPADAKPEDYIFSGAEPMNGNRYTQEWLLWCRDVGLVERREEKRGRDKNGKPRITMGEFPSLTAHQLRHGYATILYEAGIDEITAKELLGHADIQTTHAIYTHLRQGKRDEAAKVLNDKFNSIV